MTTLQEYLNKYPTYYTNEEIKNIEELDIRNESLEGHLDLSDFVSLKKLMCGDNNLTSLDLSKNANLVYLSCYDNNLNSLDFLNTLPNPEKLELLEVLNNNIQPTDIAVFSRLVNLKFLKIGTSEAGLKNKSKRNYFYGSLKSYQNLTKLEFICIEVTDVNEGLEYLSESLVKATKENKYYSIECSPRNTNAKCATIQNELRPFNYDMEAWQLAHPELMLKVRQEKISQLENQIKLLQTKPTSQEQQTQTEFSTQEKGTQTDLTAEQITNLGKQVEQLKKLLQATETELTNTKKQLQETQKKLNNVLLSLHDLQSENKELIAMQTTIKQLQSKIKLLEQQKETYQEKYNHSLDFIKEIREDIAEIEK